MAKKSKKDPIDSCIDAALAMFKKELAKLKKKQMTDDLSPQEFSRIILIQREMQKIEQSRSDVMLTLAGAKKNLGNLSPEEFKALVESMTKGDER